MRLGIIFLSIFVLSAAFISTDVPRFEYNPWPAFQKGLIESVSNEEPVFTVATSSMFFGGDVLLARDVERNMVKYGADYPYKNLKEIWRDATDIVVNFESTAPNTHVPTPDLTTSFSSPLWVLDELAEAGVTLVSLANNHALDKGQRAYIETVDNIESLGIEVFGHPKEIDNESISYVEFGEQRVALIALHDIDGDIDTAAISQTFTTAASSSDLQIVYIHWGQEYKLLHSTPQEALATFMIDAGADMIIGHHPHVVQDIQIYKDTLIVYSLGNLVFDQYFSAAVQEGLLLELSSDENKVIRLNLLPVTSIGSRVQPRLMAEREQSVWLEALANRSEASIKTEILTGSISLDKNLAISPRLP